jgi:uncharacterized protein YecT (DUF1311 family)
MNQYAARDAKQADAERNRLWPQFVERARQADKRVDNGRPECKETLRETRRDWVEFRDLNNASGNCNKGCRVKAGKSSRLSLSKVDAQATRKHICQETPPESFRLNCLRPSPECIF